MPWEIKAELIPGQVKFHRPSSKGSSASFSVFNIYIPNKFVKSVGILPPKGFYWEGWLMLAGDAQERVIDNEDEENLGEEDDPS